ncbi:MAG: Dabb family protein [Bacteroidota bacterium]
MLFLFLVFSICACSNNQVANKQIAEKQKVLRHLVAFQFKEDVTDKQKAEAIQIFRDLVDKIPEIKKFEGGENINTEGRNKGFTHFCLLTFENEAARDIYLPHPEHQRVVAANKPLFSDLMVADFWGEE